MGIHKFFMSLNDLRCAAFYYAMANGDKADVLVNKKRRNPPWRDSFFFYNYFSNTGISDFDNSIAERPVFL